MAHLKLPRTCKGHKPGNQGNVRHDLLTPADAANAVKSFMSGESPIAMRL